MKKTLFITALLSLFLNPTFAKKAHMIAELGDIKCLKKTSQVGATLDSLNISVDGATRAEKKLVADVGNTLEELTNQAGAERILGGLTIKFKDVLGNRSDGGCLPAHQLVRNQIHMGRKCSNGMKIPYT